jgi:catechol 2,3-dioxygenase-like lactoylglutathione lyase family enzyme
MAEQGTGLGHFLQGVQHVGITVNDMAQSLEFYTEVLGGKLAVGESGLQGDTMQNTLFQKEEIDAIAQGQDLESLDVPDLRSGGKAIDVRFISFGNAVVELIHFHSSQLDVNSPSVVNQVQSHIGHVNAKHLSFQVKESVDLNQFAQMLETECAKRGIQNVVFNRIVRAKTAAERSAIAQRSNSFKFWNEPDPDTGELADTEWGEFGGWSLFYCKGPSGEQLEFNQVTRNVKTLFAQAQAEYNAANGTSF